MTFSIIGTGNTAWFLATKLSEAGHTCSGVYGRHEPAATGLADVLLCPVYKTLAEVKETDVCIIAIADHAIESVAAQLNFKTTVVIHTAGSLSTDILAVSSDSYGVLWPIYSIIKTDLPKHRNVPTVWDASNAKAKEIIEQIAKSFTEMLFFSDDDQRRWLHLSAVMSNNFINHLLAICEKICDANSVPFPLLFPIIIQTLERVTSASPYDLQTGPAKRGDEAVIQKHMDMLANHPDRQAVYNALTTSIKNMYPHHHEENDAQ